MGHLEPTRYAIDLDHAAEQLRRDFDLNGYVSLPDFLSPGEIAEVNERKRHFLEGTLGTLPPELVYYEDKNDAGTLIQIQKLHDHDRYFGAMMVRSKFEQLAGILLGEHVVGQNIQYFNKPAGSGKPTPPHQDGYYFMLEPSHALTMWLALEDVGDDQGCVHYVSGSHKLGMRPHDSSAVLGFSQQVSDFGTPNDHTNEVACPCKAGHLIVHHSLTIHWAGGNISADKSREALGLIYYGESAREDEAAHAEYQRRLAAELAAQNRI